MKTLTVEEAVNGLGRWVDLALAGEIIQIRQGDAVVELRPTKPPAPNAADGQASARQALQELQAEARLTPQQVEDYLRELGEERLAAEERWRA